jgi:hypothetical protein
VSPADIVSSAEFRAGLARRLAEVGLVPAEQPAVRLAPAPESPATAPVAEERQAA